MGSFCVVRFLASQLIRRKSNKEMRIWLAECCKIPPKNKGVFDIPYAMFQPGLETNIQTVIDHLVFILMHIKIHHTQICFFVCNRKCFSFHFIKRRAHVNVLLQCCVTPYKPKPEVCLVRVMLLVLAHNDTSRLKYNQNNSSCWIENPINIPGYISLKKSRR